MAMNNLKEAVRFLGYATIACIQGLGCIQTC